MKNVDRLMRQGMAEGVFPGAVVLAAQGGRVEFCQAYGAANIFTGRAVERRTIFDLASLTKPLATALALMHLVAQRKLHLSNELAAILPAFRQTAMARATLADLLYHRSGLPDYQPYYQRLAKKPFSRCRGLLKEMLLRETLRAPVGTRVCYSDIGFLILQWVVEETAGEPLNTFVASHLYRPLGLDRAESGLFFVNLGQAVAAGAYAATEHCAWRGRLLQGEVHDENASAMGGVAGHAGLFGCVDAVYRLLASLWAGFQGRRTDIDLPPELIRRFMTPETGVGRGLGFDAPTPPAPSCGRHFSARSAGHLGFTGTSFWLDLENGSIVVLLTNRVHPTRKNRRITAFRPQLHDAVMENFIKH